MDSPPSILLDWADDCVMTTNEENMRIFGIPIKVHWSSAFIFAILIFSKGLWPGLLLSVIILVALLGHEAAHSLAARKIGYPTENITIWALGGAAFITGMGQMTPQETVYVSLSGPLFNIFCALFAMTLLILSPEPFSKTLSLVVAINFLMGFFNMIPAYPMDGGRCFLAWMRMMGIKNAINIAETATIISGCGIATLGIIIGSPILTVFGFISALFHNIGKK